MQDKYDTEIDHIDAENERLIIRGKNLDDIMNSMDFVDAITHTLIERKFDDKEKRLFNAVLVSFHAGFDICPPTTLVSRLAASTGVDISQALAAGYCAGGPYHVGAVSKAMEYYSELCLYEAEDLNGHVEKSVDERLEKGLKIYGFGHPQFNKDPRPDVLRELAHDLDYGSTYLDAYDIIQQKLLKERGINPNVDGINAALLLSFGFRPDHGTALFLFSRTIGMIAHIVEEKERKPFDVWYKTMGKLRYHKDG